MPIEGRQTASPKKMEGKKMDYETEGTLNAEDAAALAALAEAAATDEALADALAEALADAKAEAQADAAECGGECAAPVQGGTIVCHECAEALNG